MLFKSRFLGPAAKIPSTQVEGVKILEACAETMCLSRPWWPQIGMASVKNLSCITTGMSTTPPPTEASPPAPADEPAEAATPMDTSETIPMETSQTSPGSPQTATDGKTDAATAAEAAADAAATTAAVTTDDGATTEPPSTAKNTPTDQAVLEYLKSKGMESAFFELQAKLQEHQQTYGDGGTKVETEKEQKEPEDDKTGNQSLTLNKPAGGGLGYDLDARTPIIQWGVPDAPTVAGTTGGSGVLEARAYLDAFCSLQLWVLRLPDHSSSGSSMQTQTANAIARAKRLIQQGQDHPTKKVSLATVMEETTASDTASTVPTGTSAQAFQLPPSAKPELLAVTFALLVHTYCELLEAGMETTAHVIRDAFHPIYEPFYGESLKDLYNCVSNEDIAKLNTRNRQHMETLEGLKNILRQIASLQLRQEEVSQAHVTDPQQQQAQKAKIQEYNQTIAILQQKHNELSKRASQTFDRMDNLPFLRRARAVRWQLTMSTTSYGLLAQFLNSTSLQSSLLSMSTLLQTKCELQVEQRDPVPVPPAIVLDDNRDKRHPDLNEKTLVNWAAPVPPSAFKEERKTQQTGEKPFPPYHLKEEYEDERLARRDKRSVEFNRALLIHGFRRLEALERKREFDVMNGTNSKQGATNDEDGDGKAHSDHQGVGSAYQLANPMEPSILLSTLCANNPSSSSDPMGVIKSRNKATSKRRPGAALDILPSSAGPGLSTKLIAGQKTTTSASFWEEAGIGLTCAKLSPTDGRQVAVGCDDSAVRIWDLALHDRLQDRGEGSSQEACLVLLGHKSGFPVFDVSWNKDGRSLLSAGGDGSIRLWDTVAQGPFGQVLEEPITQPLSNSSPKKSSDNKPLTNATAKEALTKATTSLQHARNHPDMNVPGLKPESNPYQSGAALAVYRGHAPHTPVWSVAFAPSGYYFASAGGDATARLWTTDRPNHVRLFAGHTSDNVHSVDFHPNCNYILTGAEDKTARLWDILTGRCVRVMNGCSAGVHQVKVDPSGQYAAGADASGSIHIWDLGTGKKVTEFRAKAISSTSSEVVNRKANPKHMWGMIHALSFSACGTALASGGDDQCVRIWDIQQAIRNKSPVVEYPLKSFPTRRTMILDLEFTKRNLLLSVGKYISPVTLVNPISD